MDILHNEYAYFYQAHLTQQQVAVVAVTFFVPCKKKRFGHWMSQLRHVINKYLSTYTGFVVLTAMVMKLFSRI
jgi:hypothetical protein